jgi:cyclophilin family peptidyl-prolyl cis-trans isomerase
VEQQPDRRWIILAVFAVVAIGVVVAVLVGQGGGSDEETTTGAKGPEQVLEPGETATAVVKTSEGTFDIALDTERAPKTTNSFAYLAEKGFYDGLTFHRVAPGFVIQGGDPQGNGTGGPGYSVDEKPPPNLSYTKGVVAMAKSGTDPPGRSGSQFFVVTAPDAGLPPEYALLGKVSKGYDAVEKIDALGTPQETPKRKITIEELTIERE